MAFNRFETDVENIQKLDDRPQITAQQLKQRFDQADIDLKTAINNLMDQLEALTSASNLGAEALGDEYVSTNIQGILQELKEVSDLLKNADNITVEASLGYPTESVAQRLYRIKDTIDNLIIGQIPVGSISNSQLANDIKVGSLAQLNTTTKTNVVSAINETVLALSRVNTAINTLQTNLAPKDFTILTTDWTQEGEGYTATITDTTVTANDMADVAIDSTTYTIAEDAGVKSYTVEVVGGIKLFAESVPTGTISGKYTVNRGVANG